MRDIKLRARLLKNIFLCRNFQPKILEKALMYMLYCSVQIISRLDSQSKFQIFTLFSGRHVGVPRRYTNMAAPYWAL